MVLLILTRIPQLNLLEMFTNILFQSNYSQPLMDKHKFSIEQLIHRDRNHASVVMWSIANEPRTKHFNADQYFGLIAKYTKELDPTRPITAAIAQPMQEDKAVSSMTYW